MREFIKLVEPFFVFYTEFATYGPRFIPQSVFYTQSVMLSPPFISESAFYTQSVVRSTQSVFYTDRKFLMKKMIANPAFYIESKLQAISFPFPSLRKCSIKPSTNWTVTTRLELFPIPDRKECLGNTQCQRHTTQPTSVSCVSSQLILPAKYCAFKNYLCQ